MSFYEEDNSKSDYFDGPDVPDKPKEEPRRPDPDPDDPEYWYQDEPEWEHLKFGNKKRVWLWTALCGVAIGLIIALYIIFFSPAVTDASVCGYVEQIETRGMAFKTFEGILLPYKELKDTTRVYKHDFLFSVRDPKVAANLRRMQYANRPVRIEYRRYRSLLPWRGEQKVLVTAVDSVDPRTILPPEFAPEVP